MQLINFNIQELGSALKRHIHVIGKQYQQLNRVHGFDKKEDDETINMKPTIKK